MWSFLLVPPHISHCKMKAHQASDAIADTYVAREAARAGARRAGPTSVTDLNTHERSDAVRSRGVDLNSPLILHPSCSDLAAIAQRPCVAQHSCF